MTGDPEQLPRAPVPFDIHREVSGSATFRIRRERRPAQVRFTWQETGGPPVAVPQRKGFGSLLIASSSQGESAVDYRPDGVRCLLHLDI
jgi:two-component sensor histidine kinase